MKWIRWQGLIAFIIMVGGIENLKEFGKGLDHFTQKMELETDAVYYP